MNNPTPKRMAHPKKRRGIALLVTLVVVLLITFFLSELHFTSGLELRSLQSYQQIFRARSLARSAFAAVEGGLRSDEVLFTFYFRQLQQVLQFSPIPWEDGLLIEMKVVPLDPLFNLNRLESAREGENSDLLNWSLFRNLMADVIVEPNEYSLTAALLDESYTAEIYAALADWADSDTQIYGGHAPALGAESGDYFGEKPDFLVKNALLDRLSEIRLVRGISGSGITWADWEKRFTVYEEGNGSNLYPGLINPNVAEPEEMIAFLEARYMEDVELLGGTQYDDQEALNEYSDNAEDIVGALLGNDDEAGRPKHTSNSIKEALVLASGNGNYADQVFTPVYHYYRISIITEVDDIQAHLTAVVYANRNEETRMASEITIKEMTLN